VRSCVVEKTGDGTVWKNLGVMFVTSIIKRGCDLDCEGEDTPDHLSRREIVIGKGDRRDEGE